MKAEPSRRTSAAKAGGVLVVLLVAWSMFLFTPRRERPQDEPEPLPVSVSELRKVGLPDNVDLELLPGIFAVWADRAEWRDDRTFFAYRHPVSGEFSYHVEAQRAEGGYRFSLVGEPRSKVLDADMPEDVPVRFYRTPVESGQLGGTAPTRPADDLPADRKVEVELEAGRIDIPAPEKNTDPPQAPPRP